jgi:exosortase F-associated protein
MQTPRLRYVIGIASAMALLMIFLFQGLNPAKLMGVYDKYTAFLVNRMIRFFLNDLFAFGLIYALFPYRKYLVFALWIQLAGVIFFLIPYFIVKYYYPHYNGPLINYLHRLILNPTLLLLLIFGFYYQRYSQKTT